MTRILFAGQLLLISCCGIAPLGAANIAFDSAADAVYNNGWQAGDNGGFGFTPWAFLPQGSAGQFMGTSTANGDGLDDGNSQGIAGDSDIDTAGRSWGLFARNGNSAIAAFRQLTGGPLSIGQAIEIDFDNGSVDTTQFAGLQFITNSDYILFRYHGGDSTYEVYSQNLTAHQQSTLGFADEGLSFNLLRTGSTTFDLKVTLRNGNSQTLPLTTLDGNVMGIVLQNSASGLSPANDAFFNSMRVGVVPEPSSVVMLAFGCVGLTRRYRQWRK
ncbi:PEP-CTERM sorting domain-containing protein [Bythopirellula goksoeyrii]|uniref:PEP-CTERM protein-sorting domain-containing protein n=1 Tax=Bythopirellula goksoeyrii TaxID=1400387 RepID=A0A5B9QFM9_9BACT|nr:PEP-CTERM sorting domain-containing protein [Bythopirellula goksoeyrii]QEG35716.1 hypothetical protein Pr1d_30190 [Bythopirellula goksoeyrii]